jgi:heptaprenyl diphosphate synthase
MQTAAIAYYLPVLMISGIITGVVIGIVAALIVRRVEKLTRK